MPEVENLEQNNIDNAEEERDQMENEHLIDQAAKLLEEEENVLQNTKLNPQAEPFSPSVIEAGINSADDLSLAEDSADAPEDLRSEKVKTVEQTQNVQGKEEVSQVKLEENSKDNVNSSGNSGKATWADWFRKPIDLVANSRFGRHVNDSMQVTDTSNSKPVDAVNLSEVERAEEQPKKDVAKPNKSGKRKKSVGDVAVEVAETSKQPELIAVNTQPNEEKLQQTGEQFQGETPFPNRDPSVPVRKLSFMNSTTNSEPGVPRIRETEFGVSVVTRVAGVEDGEKDKGRCLENIPTSPILPNAEEKATSSSMDSQSGDRRTELLGMLHKKIDEVKHLKKGEIDIRFDAWKNDNMLRDIEYLAKHLEMNAEQKKDDQQLNALGREMGSMKKMLEQLTGDLKQEIANFQVQGVSMETKQMDCEEDAPMGISQQCEQEEEQTSFAEEMECDDGVKESVSETSTSESETEEGRKTREDQENVQKFFNTVPTGKTDIQVNMVTGVIGDGTSQNPQDSGKGSGGGKRTDPSRGQAQVTTAYDNSRNALFGGGSSGGTSGGSGNGGNGGNGGRQPNLGGHANDSGSVTTRSKKSLLGISKVRVFSGEDGDVARGWAETMIAYINEAKMSNMEAKIQIMNNLDGKAKRYFESLTPEESADWKQIVVMIDTRWNMWDAAASARDKFAQRKHEDGELPSVFLEELLILRRKGNPDESLQLSHEAVIKQFLLQCEPDELYNFVQTQFSHPMYRRQQPTMEEFKDVVGSFGGFGPTPGERMSRKGGKSTPMGVNPSAPLPLKTNSSMRTETWSVTTGNSQFGGEATPKPAEQKPKPAPEQQQQEQPTSSNSDRQNGDQTQGQQQNQRQRLFGRYNSMQQRRPKPRSANPRHQNDECWYCNKPGHHREDCPDFRKECFSIYDDLTWNDVDAPNEEQFGPWHIRVNEVTSGKCYNCGEMGHFQNRCPKERRMKKTDYLEKEMTDMKSQLKEVLEMVKTLRSAQTGQQQN